MTEYKRYGFIDKSVSFFLLIIAFVLLIFFNNDKLCAEEKNYIDDLVRSAFEKKLYDDKYWHILLHYRKGLFGTESLIDDPKFFLAKDGKHNPRSEIEATIRYFFTVDGDNPDYPVCRFIARFKWLKEKLDINVSALPVPECAALNNIINNIKPESATVIFPTSYMNSPGSMFGHTLLAVETADRSKLLSSAINYSARTDESFGPVFAFKGIFGFYKGYFSILPYYAKVEEYSNVNNRDIWEYRLNLSKEEVIRMVMQLYELNNIYSDYYFFDENCSYNLLYLLDAARPSLGLTDEIDLWVIPIDTIRLALKGGLVESIEYRPSKAVKIGHIASLLDKKNKNLALGIANQEIDADGVSRLDIDSEEKIKILDLAREYIQYKYSQKEIKKDRYTDIFLKISRLRSKLGNPDVDRYKIKKPPEPSEGHRSGRLGLGAGVKGGGYFQDLLCRGAYHDLLDADEGYQAGSQIQFLNVGFRYYYEEKKLQLANFDLVDIFSISPVDSFFKPVSWKLNTGFETKDLKDKSGHLIYKINTGFGYSVDLKFPGLLYAIAEPEADFGRGLEKNYAVGTGGTLGVLNKIAGIWKVHLYVRDIYYSLGERHNEIEISLQQNFKISMNNSLRFELSRTGAFDFWYNEIKLYWNYFY